jgi:hypothetical protein
MIEGMTKADHERADLWDLATLAFILGFGCATVLYLMLGL